MHRTTAVFAALCLSATALATTAQEVATSPGATPLVIGTPALASKLKVGDVVFIRVAAKPFREVADATRSWTNHVGIVIDTAGPQPLIGESKFPFSTTTPLSKFVARSEGGRVAVSRLAIDLSNVQRDEIRRAAEQRARIHYDTGFDLHSRGEFCSRYVHEVIAQATGVQVGEVETFTHLLANNPDAHLGFWRAWYFGSIPWQRETVTPASVLRSAALRPVFDGTVTPAGH